MGKSGAIAPLFRRDSMCEGKDLAAYLFGVRTLKKGAKLDSNGNRHRYPMKNAIRPALKSVLTTIALFFLAVVLGAQPAAAQKGAVRDTYGAWSIVCDTPPGASEEQCVLMQNVVAADRDEFGISVVVLKTADKKARILRVLVPLGVLLPNGLGLNIDGNDIGRAYFVRCFTDGCYAEVILEDSLIKSLSEGKDATFYVFQSPEEGIGISVDLNGFAEGYKALP